MLLKFLNLFRAPELTKEIAVAIATFCKTPIRKDSIITETETRSYSCSCKEV